MFDEFWFSHIGKEEICTATECELPLSVKYFFCCSNREKICQSVPPTCHSIMFIISKLTGDLTRYIQKYVSSLSKR